MLGSKERKVRPMDLGPSREPLLENLNVPAEITWIQPTPDPADTAVEKETIRLAFVAALQHLPPRQRAVLILCEVLRWQATEISELLETSVASVNSALQRARAGLEATGVSATDPAPALGAEQRDLLDRYVKAFEAYDIDALTELIREDAIQSMPPFDLWLSGRDDIFTWWFGPGIGCAGSRVLPAGSANGSPAYGQYKPSDVGKRIRPVGVAGGRGLSCRYRRAHLLPRHRDALPALRAAGAARLLAARRDRRRPTSSPSSRDTPLKRAQRQPSLTRASMPMDASSGPRALQSISIPLQTSLAAEIHRPESDDFRHRAGSNR